MGLLRTGHNLVNQKGTGQSLPRVDEVLEIVVAVFAEKFPSQFILLTSGLAKDKYILIVSSKGSLSGSPSFSAAVYRLNKIGM